MADIDYRRLTDKQLEAVAAVNGDFSKLSDADFKSINDTLEKTKPGLARRAVNAVDENVITPINEGVNWLGTQFTKGITGALGTPDAVGNLAQRGAQYVGDAVGAPETGNMFGRAAKSALTFHGVLPSTEAMNSTIFGGAQPANVFGVPIPQLNVPEVNAGDDPRFTVGGVNVGKMADVGMQAIPSAAVGVGGVLPNFLGGVTSEAGGQATKGTPWELPTRILAAGPGAWAGSKITTPLPANLTPQQARAVQIAKETGTPLSVAQETGRGTALERLFSRLPGGQGVAERFAAKQGATTDEAALAQVGFKGNEIGQETMKNVARQVGGEFEAAKNMPGIIDLTSTFPKVRETVAKYEGVMDPARRSPSVTTEANRILSKEAPSRPTYPPLTASAVEAPQATVGNLVTAVRNAGKSVDEAFDKLPSSEIKGWFNKGPMAPMPKELPELSSVQYQTLRKGLTEAIDGLYSAKDTNGAKALQAMRTSLDDAVEGSLGGDKLAAWKQARLHYYNFKIIQKAMNMGTASARSEGTLGANALTNALRRAQGDKFYETTGGLNDIATLKSYLRDTFPNSGTPTIGAQAVALANPWLAGAPAGIANLGMRAMTGGGPIADRVRNYLVNQRQTDRLGTVSDVPLALAPGMLTPDQRLRLMDGRGQ